MTPEIKNLLEATVLIAAAVGGAIALWRYIWVPIGKGILNTRAFFKRLCKGLDSIEAIQKEFKPNSGSSMKDDLSNIKERLTYIENLTSAQMEDDPQGVFICGADGANSFVNRTYCRLLGVGKEELMALNWKNFVSHTVGDKYDHLWQDAFMANREVSTDIFFQKADGTHTCCHLSILPLNRAGDKVRRFLGRIKQNPTCTADRCQMNDICPHKPLTKALLAD